MTYSNHTKLRFFTNIEVQNNFNPAGKGGRNSDPSWSQCQAGDSFFVEASEEQVRKNQKRPSIPARFQGCFKTKGGQWQGVWGYLVTRIR